MFPENVLANCPFCKQSVLVEAEIENVSGFGGMKVFLTKRPPPRNIREVKRICPNCMKEFMVQLEVIPRQKQVITTD